MTDVKISQLDDIGTPADDDLLPVVDVSANVTKKLTIGVIRGLGGIVGAMNAYLEIDSYIHAATHIKAADDEIDGDTLDIDLTPINYIPEVSAVSDDLAHLASHLAGIDTALGSVTITSHATSHRRGGIDQVDGDRLDIDWNPTNYTPATTSLSNHVDHLASHLAGIDTRLGQAAAAEIHASSHITAGTDEIDGDKLDVDWTPANYTPTVTAQSDNVDHLSSHLSGIDILLGNLDFTERTGLASNLSAIGIKDAATIDTNTVGFGGALRLSADANFDDADSDTSAGMPCSALALASGTGTGKPILLLGLIRNDACAWTPGGLVYVSGTAGALTQTIPTGAGKWVQVVGIARTATILFFNPSYVMVERVA